MSLRNSITVIPALTAMMALGVPTSHAIPSKAFFIENSIYVGTCDITEIILDREGALAANVDSVCLVGRPGNGSGNFSLSGGEASIRCSFSKLTVDGSGEIEITTAEGCLGGFDTDGDGIPDSIEDLYAFLDPNNAADAAADEDGDRLSNLDEFRLGTGLNDSDSDNDGTPDGLDPDPRDAAVGRAVFADLDGDGISDVIWRNSTSGLSRVWQMSASGPDGILRSSIGEMPASAEVAGLGDFNGDGRVDMLWRDSVTGVNEIAQSRAGGTSFDTARINTVIDLAWQVAAVGDLNGDGRDDILWRNTDTGLNFIYQMGPNGYSFTAAPMNRVPDQNWEIAGVGDFNADGRDDVFWRHAVSGLNYVYTMNSDGITFTARSLNRVVDTGWGVQTVADLDGNGVDDLLWRHATTGENYIYLMNADTGRFSGFSLNRVPDSNWTVVGGGDYNGDGQADILWRHAANGQNYLYLMNPGAKAFTGVPLETVPGLEWSPESGS